MSAPAKAEHRVPLRRNRPLQGFIGALLVSLMGDQIYSLALPWLVYNLTGSALAMGTLYAVVQLPVLLNPFLGVLVDRFDRRRLLVLADAVRALCVGLVPVLWSFHLLAIWYLYVLGLILTTLGQLYNVTTFAITPLVVPESDVAALNSLFLSLTSAASTVGPALAGLCIAALGAPLALTLDAISFLLTLLSLVWFRPGTAPAPTGRRSGLLADTAWALRYYVAHRLLLPLGIYFLLFNLGYWLFFSQLVFHYRHDLNLSAQATGLLFALVGLGMTVGALVAPRFMRRLSWSGLMVWSRVICGVGLIVHAHSRGMAWLALSGLVAASIGSVSGVISNTLRQRVIPTEMLGRIQGVHTLFAFGGIPLGAALSGPMAEAWGAVPVLVIGGAIWIFSALVVLLSLRGVHSPTAATDAD